MNIEIMTEILQMMIMNAITLAQENHHSEIDVEHILFSMLETDALDGLLERLKRYDKSFLCLC